jgi:hypothetical protein
MSQLAVLDDKAHHSGLAQLRGEKSELTLNEFAVLDVRAKKSPADLGTGASG